MQSARYGHHRLDAKSELLARVIGFEHIAAA